MALDSITIWHAPASGAATQVASLDEVAHLLSGPGWSWIDVLDPAVAAADAVAAVLQLHEPDIEDMSHETQFPKVEERPEYIFLIAHTTSLDETRFRTVEVDLVLGDNFLLTMRREDSPGFDILLKMMADGAIEGPDELMARALEIFGRRMLPMLAGVDELIYELEDRSLGGDPSVPQLVQALRRDTIRLRRVVAPQRDAQKLLAANRTHVKSEAARARFVSGYDDAVRIADSLDTARSLLGSVLETYRATVAERMNEVMKVLTVFSAIVLPLGLLAGLFGMNFVDMPWLDRGWGFSALVVVMALIAIGLWAYFVRRRFIGGPRLPRVDQAVSRGMASFVHLSLAPVRLLERALTSDTDGPD